MMSVSNNAKNKSETSITIIKKLVPHLGCKVGNFWAFSGERNIFFSKAKMVLCSAPWYSNNLLTSFKNEIPQTYIRKNAIRIIPDTKLNKRASFSILKISVVK